MITEHTKSGACGRMGNTGSSHPKNRANASVLKKKVEHAAKTGVLSLPEHKLKEFPEAILSLHNLRVLDLSANALITLPDAFASSSTKLKTLKVSKNKLNRLPRLPETLSILDATRNEIAEIDVELPASLESLSLRENPLARFPRAVLNLSKLKSLDLADCGLDSLDELASASFAALQELILDNNSIARVPDIIVVTAPRLKRLALEYNKIAWLPADVLKSPNLDRLDLKGNVITKSTFLKLDGAEDFLKRREKTRLKDTAGGAIADLGVCGLDS